MEAVYIVETGITEDYSNFQRDSLSVWSTQERARDALKEAAASAKRRHERDLVLYNNYNALGDSTRPENNREEKDGYCYRIYMASLEGKITKAWVR